MNNNNLDNKYFSILKMTAQNLSKVNTPNVAITEVAQGLSTPAYGMNFPNNYKDGQVYLFNSIATFQGLFDDEMLLISKCL